MVGPPGLEPADVGRGGLLGQLSRAFLSWLWWPPAKPPCSAPSVVRLQCCRSAECRTSACEVAS